jgi:hypothetical protein
MVGAQCVQTGTREGLRQKHGPRRLCFLHSSIPYVALSMDQTVFWFEALRVLLLLRLHDASRGFQRPLLWGPLLRCLPQRAASGHEHEQHASGLGVGGNSPQ